MRIVIPSESGLNRILERLQQEVPAIDADSIRAMIGIAGGATTLLASIESHFTRYGLSQGRFAVLMPLYFLQDEDWTPAKLAEFTGVTRATLTGLLDVLERDEWIERRPHADDGRMTEIVLTRRGRSRFRRILPDHFERLGRVQQVLTAKERETLFELMGKLSAASRTLAAHE